MLHDRDRLRDEFDLLDHAGQPVQQLQLAAAVGTMAEPVIHPQVDLGRPERLALVLLVARLGVEHRFLPLVYW